jgi:RHS repeat-associated protein
VFDAGETMLAQYDYVVRLDGKRESVTETDATGTATFDWVYDELGRLTEETYNGPGTANDFTAEYFFDLASNRLRKEIDRGNDSSIDEVIAYLYDENDRLLSEALDSNNDLQIDQTAVYEYGDDNDRTEQTKKTVWQGEDIGPTGTKLSETTYTYDVRGRLATVDIDSDADGNIDSRSTYAYNDNGIRVHEKVEKDLDDAGGFDETTETDYVVDANNPTGYAQVLEERNALNGIVAKTFTLGLDVIAQQAPAIENGDTLYLLYDSHGSTRLLVDPTGQPLDGQVYRYDAYGNPIGFDPIAALTSLLYSGEHTDITGLQYLRARYYDIATGRFTRLDPFGGNTYDSLSLHKYLYTHGNPIMGIDPSGLYTQELGNAAHLAIQAEHRLVFPFPTEVVYGQWAGLQDAIRAKPDILNLTDFEYNEIKPLSPSGIAQGLVQMRLRDRQFGPLGFEPDADWPAVPGFATAGTVPIIYFNIAGVIFYTDAVDLIEDIVAVRALNIGYQAASRLLAQRATTLVTALGRIPQLVALQRGIDGNRAQSNFSIAVMIASFGVI